ncbi:hypothetical protein L3Q82_006284 [Scortum barcoo]|uniref:Uncharacterized protein n=1 Tax=Scortum barcoo TaxID=214431 RepID=A0ACB8X4J5_9TELE|nr:hypothetical protein L3Q82_006284 [Scortum barcoo]
MQDNARPHVAGVCQQFLQDDEGIDAMDWPAHPFPSPDLNPIDHIWDIMSRSIHQRHVAPQTVQELAEDALVQVWEEIPQETIRHLIRSMPRHLVHSTPNSTKKEKSDFFGTSSFPTCNADTDGEISCSSRASGSLLVTQTAGTAVIQKYCKL